MITYTELMSGDNEDPIEEIVRQARERRQRYMTDVVGSRPFQDGLRYLEGIGSDLLMAATYVRLQGQRYAASDDYLMFRFAPHIIESALAITSNATEGLHNAARRELRFLLEAAVKLSSRDLDRNANTFEERLAGLADRGQPFDSYVMSLVYFDEFDRPDEANAAILSLYGELSSYVHAATPQFEAAMARSRRQEDAGMQSVATLNRFNALAFQVYDLVLVRLFHGLGLGMAGDIFTAALDAEPKWRFHKAKFVGRLSRCFDYKQERQQRLGEA